MCYPNSRNKSLIGKAFASSLVFLLACGGGGGSSTTSTPPPPPPPPVPPAEVEVLLGGDLESGTYWSNPGIIQPAPSGFTAHSGSKLAWIGGYGTSDEFDAIRTEVGIPADSTTATLTFWMQVDSKETGTTAVDTCTLKAYDSATGNLLGNLATFSNLEVGGWSQRTYNLLPYKGKALNLEWKSQENEGKSTSFFLDDASVKIGGAASKPAVLALVPSSGYAGEDFIEVLGTFTFGATAVQFNGTGGSEFSKVNGARCRARIPLTASTGAVSVATPLGTAVSSTSATIQHRTPTISQFNPTRGAQGTKIIVEGEHFTSTSAVTVGGVAASFTVDSDNQLTVTVPAGGTSGVLVVTSSGGAGLTSTPFTVTTNNLTTDYFFGSIHFNQATQNSNGDVPVIANRDGYLRVFLRANQAGLPVPALTVQLETGAGKETLSPANTLTSVPVNPSLGTWGDSLNYLVPAAKIANGMSITVIVNEGGTLPEADSTNNSVIFTPVVKALSTFRTTLIPVIQGGTTGDVSQGATGWTSRFKSMFPIGGLDAEVASPWTYTGAELKEGGEGWSGLLTALEQKRVAEASTRYYYGVLGVGYSSGVAGLGYVPNSGSTTGRSAIGWDKTGFGDGGDYNDVFAHETGHNLGRFHSPCGSAGSPDKTYPYPGGSIGQPGLNVADASLKSATTYKDIMGYCKPNWVSDHVYKGVISHREATPQPLTGGYTATQPCLLLTATQNGGGFQLEPFFVLETLPTAEATQGVQLEGVSVGGKKLFSRHVEVAVIGCGPMEGARTIVAAIPLEGLSLENLQALRLVENDTVLARIERPSAARRIVATPPSARRIEGGMELRWDAQAYPMALVRDSVTGEILATLRGGSAHLPLVGPYAELLLSDGVNSTRQPLPEPVN